MQHNNIFKLRKALFLDWPFLLSIRNDLETRNNSHNISIINEKEHCNWLKSTLENSNKFLFIFSTNDHDCGSVRCDYDFQDNSFELSWSVSPLYRKKGFGQLMVNECIKVIRFSKRFKSEVKEGNLASILISEHIGLKFSKIENGVLYFNNF